MDDVTRRAMLWGAGASVAATGLIQEAAARTAAFGPDDPYDLVVRGGEVLDPSQNLRGRRDIGIRNAAIVAGEPETPGGPARRGWMPRASSCCPASSTSTPMSCRAAASACRATSWCPTPAPPPM